MIIIYDTETTGLARDRLPPDDPGQPHLVQLAASLIEDDGTERASMSMIVRPDGWTIPEEASRVHGISQDLAARVGVPLRVAVACFTNLRALADEAVAHNEKFDWTVVEAALARLGVTPEKPWPKRICTAQGPAADHVGLPPTERMLAAGFNKPKTPNLQELHKHLFGEGFDGAHDALIDVRACARCFTELRKRAVL